MQTLAHFGKYLIMLREMLAARERFKVYWDQTMLEIVSIGVGSIGIVLIISFFVGAVLTVQTAYQLISPLIPRSTIGQIVSATTLLEMSPTITSLVLAGKIGSSIASQLGTMRVYEQIDALDVMGINSPSYLILPKVIASLVSFPMLVIISCFVMHIGGILAGELTGYVSTTEFAVGARFNFTNFQFIFMLIKAITFGLLISSISSYHGYFVKGGALEVGQASTRAVVYSCIGILCSDYVLAQFLL